MHHSSLASLFTYSILLFPSSLLAFLSPVMFLASLLPFFLPCAFISFTYSCFCLSSPPSFPLSLFTSFSPLPLLASVPPFYYLPYSPSSHYDHLCSLRFLNLPSRSLSFRIFCSSYILLLIAYSPTLLTIHLLSLNTVLPLVLSYLTPSSLPPGAPDTVRDCMLANQSAGSFHIICKPVADEGLTQTIR